MSVGPLGGFLPVAREAACEAGRAVMELLKAPLVKARKADDTLVTNADGAANDLILGSLRRAFPGHGILSEETGWDGPAGAEFAWIVDPLDGTRAYAGGRNGFSVMIGLLHEGCPVLGVVYVPSEDRLYEAVRGEGAFHVHGGRRERLRVSDRSDPASMAVVTSTGFPEDLKRDLRADFPGPWRTPINSVGVKAGLVARGEADVYLSHRAVHLWDTAGPLAILEEAGGRMTLWDGAPLTYDLRGPTRHPAPVLATNGASHAWAAEALISFRLKNQPA